jgi:myo-inositol-1-phosphate synthase
LVKVSYTANKLINEEIRGERVSQEIRLALVGVGNCASALLQGLAYYAKFDSSVGIMHRVLGGYDVTDIKPVVAFDVNARKVGCDLAEAIMAPPNCAYRVPDVTVAPTGVQVLMGPVEDGAPSHLAKYMEIADRKPVDVVQALKDSGAQVMLNMLPTGSARAARLYAQAALEAGVAFMNGMPELIVCDPAFAQQATERNIPVVGDDVKSQLGGTILHRAMVEAMQARGIHIRRTYQLNYAGNTDFDNLVHRGESKEQTKREAVEALIPYQTQVSAAFAHVPNMGDRKTTRFYFELANFSNAPLIVDAKLEVEDSANFGGTVVDAIRCCKVALDRKVGGVLTSASAFFCKHPAEQYSDQEAVQMVEEFIEGVRER